MNYAESISRLAGEEEEAERNVHCVAAPATTRRQFRVVTHRELSKRTRSSNLSSEKVFGSVLAAALARTSS
jgi:hypothetical protein